MNAKSHMERFVADKGRRRLLNQEELILEVTEKVCEVLEKAGVSRQELARRMGRSKGFVTQLLGGGRNLTLRTLADISFALGRKLRLDLTGEPKVPSKRAGVVRIASRKQSHYESLAQSERKPAHISEPQPEFSKRRRRPAPGSRSGE